MDNDSPKSVDDLFVNVEKLTGKKGTSRRYSELEVSQVEPGPWQPRQVFVEEEIDNLAASIARDGQLDPILVIFRDGKYLIVAGERRFRAIQKLGRSTIEALLLPDATPDNRVKEIAIVSNVQREDLDPFEEASSYQVLMDEHNHTLESLGEVLGKKKSTIHDVLQINALPLEWREDFRLAGKRVSKTMLVEIAREKDPQLQLSLWESVRDGKVTTKQEVREKKREAKPQKPVSKRSIKQRYVADMRLIGNRAKQMADEGIDLSRDEFDAVLPDWDLVDAYIQGQRKKLDQ